MGNGKILLNQFHDFLESVDTSTLYLNVKVMRSSFIAAPHLILNIVTIFHQLRIFSLLVFYLKVIQQLFECVLRKFTGARQISALTVPIL